MKAEEQSRPTLIRTLGQWDLTAIGVNQVIGAGIVALINLVLRVVFTSQPIAR